MIKNYLKKMLHNHGAWMYSLSGKRPWKPGYVPYKYAAIRKAIAERALLGERLPDNYGYRLDERIVEYPWFFSRLPDVAGRILDAGSVLNYKFILEQPLLSNKRIFISTLAPEWECFWRKSVSYVYEDLRETCFRENYFDWVVSLSTIEHIGLDNTMLYTRDEARRENSAGAYQDAIKEFKRVLKPGGTLFLSMPYGVHVNRGWFQVFDAEMTDKAIAAFAPVSYQEFHFRYEPQGWIVSDREKSAGAAYFDIQTQKKYDEDFAAASRAVVCLELKK